MNSLKIFDGRTRYMVAAVTLAVATFISAVMPIVVGAAQLTSRSVALSSSAPAATGVTYNVTFTPVADAEAFYIDFCTVSPLVGEACATPSGFSVSSASTSTSSWTEAALDANTTLLTGEMDAGVAETVAITGVTNPSAAGSIYARIYTYDTAAHAVEANGGDDGYVDAENIGADAYVVDTGSVAISIANEISVSGDVLESLVFCVAGAAITDNCANASANAPTLTLGEEVETDVFALTDEISTGDIFTQISTNALGGAVVSMKSNTAGCGGLLRAGTGTAAERCGIAPALTLGTIGAGEAEFGVLVAADTTQDTAMTGDPSGLLQAAGTYNATTYEMNYVAGNASGVTSTYGDPVLNTDGDPAFLRNAKLTFGAQSNNSVPAGRYSANISLVATGTF